MKSWKNGIGPNIEAKLLEQVRGAEGLECLYHGDEKVEVIIANKSRVFTLAVDLRAHTCSCLAWQMSGIVCSHACAAIKSLHQNVYCYVDDCFKLSAQEKIYSSLMSPVATHDCPHPGSLTVTQLMNETLLEPPITRRPPGRPRKRRIESQFQNKRVYYCSRCREAGHTVKTCKNPNPV